MLLYEWNYCTSRDQLSLGKYLEFSSLSQIKASSSGSIPVTIVLIRSNCLLPEFLRFSSCLLEMVFSVLKTSSSRHLHLYRNRNIYYLHHFNQKNATRTLCTSILPTPPITTSLNDKDNNKSSNNNEKENQVNQVTPRRRGKRKEPLFPDPYAEPPLPSSFPKYEERPFFKFEIIHESKISSARVGRIHTPHGHIDTPGFVAVATNGALKAVDHRPLEDLLQLIFCNTYHLLLHPGPEIIEKGGGLHKFMKRSAPIITDSGGFQVFSLAHGSVQEELNMKRPRTKDEKSLLDQVSEEGATFRSYRDGTKMLLTPESSVKAQKMYGSDIIIPLDELPPYHIDRESLHRSVLLTHRWEARSLRQHLSDIRQQAMYAVIHGGIDEDLRKLSVDYLTSLPFDGYAVGGSLGKNRDELFQLLSFVMPLLPKDKPNHLLGIADIDSIYGAVPKGVDTFDSCFPTRLGRHGTLLTKRFGRLQIRQGKWKDCFEPPDWEGGLQGHTLAYLHHLYKCHEPMASTLLTLHNLLFMAEYMHDVRNKILNDEL